MIKRLMKHGNSLAFVGVLDLNIDTNTHLNIRTNSNRLIVTPIRDEARQKKFRAGLESVDRRHSRALRKPAE